MVDLGGFITLMALLKNLMSLNQVLHYALRIGHITIMDTREIFLTSETDPDAYKKFTYLFC
jgi:hypothetical protein